MYMPAGPLPTMHTRAGGGEETDGRDGGMEKVGEADAEGAGGGEDVAVGAAASVDSHRWLQGWHRRETWLDVTRRRCRRGDAVRGDSAVCASFQPRPAARASCCDDLLHITQPMGGGRLM